MKKFLLLFIASFIYSEILLAEGINQQMPGLGAKSDAKVIRFKSQLESMGAGSSIGAPQAANCGSVSVGNYKGNSRNAPREMTTIVTGDIININNGKCR